MTFVIFESTVLYVLFQAVFIMFLISHAEPTQGLGLTHRSLGNSLGFQGPRGLESRANEKMGWAKITLISEDLYYEMVTWYQSADDAILHNPLVTVGVTFVIQNRFRK